MKTPGIPLQIQGGMPGCSNNKEGGVHISIHSSRGRAWAATAEAIKDRDGYTCQLRYSNCTVDQDLSVDHVVPKVAGGTDDEWNLTTACRSCNSSKGSKAMTRRFWERKEWFA